MHTSPIIAIIGEDPAVAGLLQRLIERAAPAATVLIVPDAAALPAGCTPAIAFLRASPYYLAGFDNLRALRASAPRAVSSHIIASRTTASSVVTFFASL